MVGLETLKRLAIALTACLVLNAAVTPAVAEQGRAKRSDEYGGLNPGDPPAAGSEWIQAIVIKSPELRSEVKGNVKVEFQAPGMTAARALCWQQPTREQPGPWGHDVNLDPNLMLDAQGNGSFIFPADKFPNGPITIRIVANNEAKKQDVRELQLYNTGGVVWNQGIPKTDPPAARGMKVAFSDDFDGPLSISNNGKGKRYMAHTRGGDFSGYPFTGPESPKNPFSQKGTFLRIHASKNPADPKDRGSTGLISPVDTDGNGFYAKAPLYMECRFTAQSAPGTWAAFWTTAKRKEDLLSNKGPCDELDIIEAYGGVGKGNPNGYGLYHVVSHFWGQKGPDGKQLKLSVPTTKRIDMTQLGGKSSWSTTFHTYGLLVTQTDTVYYCDDVEVLRHPTNEISKTEGFAFLINYAIGGNSGWKIDLEREGYATDMWVDYVRVYQGQ
jgi:hypothetical protein